MRKPALILSLLLSCFAFGCGNPDTTTITNADISVQQHSVTITNGTLTLEKSDGVKLLDRTGNTLNVTRIQSDSTTQIPIKCKSCICEEGTCICTGCTTG